MISVVATMKPTIQIVAAMKPKIQIVVTLRNVLVTADCPTITVIDGGTPSGGFAPINGLLNGGIP